MRIHNLSKLLVGVFASAILLTSNIAFAEATLPEVYQAIESGQLAKADVMMQEVLKNHPNSGKAHYLASELYLKEGKLDAARNAFAQAETLAPGLPFAQPDSVQRLQAQLRAGTVPANTVANAGASSIFTSPIFWILIAILIAGAMFFMRKRQQPVQVYNAPTANGPYPGAPGSPGAYPPGYPGAPTSGMGSGLMGSLATGAALGAGMVAGEALASHLMGGGNRANPGNVNNDFNQVGSQVDAPNFGVNDAGSWDDGSAGSWDDSGGGFMDDV